MNNNLVQNVVRHSFANPDSLTDAISSIYQHTNKLADKVAIVTGSTRGIGLSIAKKLAYDGAKVIISSRKETNVLDAVAELKSHNLDVSGIVCHVGKEEDRQKLIEFTMEQYGRIDIFVSNVAVNPHLGEMLEISESQYDKIFDINVKSTFLLTQKIVPLMKRNNKQQRQDASLGNINSTNVGSIVFIGSIAGSVTFPKLSMYSISKASLNAMTKHLSKALAPENISVNIVSPGIISTKFSKEIALECMEDDDLKRIDMKRMGHPDEIGGLVSFLCSNEASYITGENICVSGGYR